MRTIICDLPRREFEGLGIGSDALFAREDLLAARDCCGCFACWVRTPGTCVFRDELQRLPEVLARTDELWVVARNAFGGYSPLVKRALDRAIGYLHPNFRIVNNEMHHRLRYGNRVALRAWLYGPSTESERESFERIARANALNMGQDFVGTWFPETAAGVGREESAAAVPTRPVALAPRTAPKRIALVNASPKGPRSATAHLLADLAEAFGAYAQLAGVTAPELVSVGCPSAAPSVSEKAVQALAGCDAAVLGYPLYVDALPAGLVELLERAQGELAPGTRVYTLANLGFYEPEQILPSFAVVESFCRAAGVCWMGGVALGGGGMILPCAHMPRMGMMRRRVSEAVDELVGALLTGGELGTVLSKPPLPRFAYKLAAERQWRTQAQKAGVKL